MSSNILKYTLSTILLCGFYVSLLWLAKELPAFGTKDTAMANEVSQHYIEKSYKETGSPNLVTAVLADYRSFDTLFETVVVFTAALACLLILGFRQATFTKPGAK